MKSAHSPLGVNVCFYPQPHQMIRAKNPDSCQKSVKPCEIGENLLSVSNPISRLQEKLIHVGALIRPPTLQRRPVSGLHPYAAVERSSPPMSPLSEPRCRSVGELPLPTRLQTLLV